MTSRTFNYLRDFLPHIIKGRGGCWIWTGHISPNGYGRIWVEGRHWNTHRFSYEIHVGKIPEGLQIDHLCRVRRCCNPLHLEPVTARENGLRGDTIQAANSLKKTCPRGHVYDKTDKRGSRHCRICDRASYRRWYRKTGRPSRKSQEAS